MGWLYVVLPCVQVMWLWSVVEVATACSTIVSPGTTFRGDLGNTSITGSVTVEAGEAEDTVGNELQ